MSDTFTLSALPAPLAWQGQPAASASDAGQELSITTGALSDWFTHPQASRSTRMRPSPSSCRSTRPSPSRRRSRLSLRPPMTPGRCSCTLSLRSGPSCASVFAQGQPMVVSVVRGVSDDCNSVDIAAIPCIAPTGTARSWPSTIRVTATTGTSCATSPRRRGGPAGRLLRDRLPARAAPRRRRSVAPGTLSDLRHGE